MLYSLQNTLTNAWFYILSATSIIFAYSYLKIGLSDPGFAHPIPSPTAEQRQNPRFCTSCHTIRSNHTHHCYDCDIWIVNYDHHCPWIGKCVGQKNLSSFYFFLLMTFGNLIMCFISTVASAPSRHHWYYKHLWLYVFLLISFFEVNFCWVPKFLYVLYFISTFYQI